MNNIPSEIIEDLLPLYRDDVLSESIKEVVEKHLETSEEARKKLSELQRQSSMEQEESELKENKFIQRIRRSRHYIIGMIIGASIPIGALLIFILYVVVMSRIG